MHATLKIQMDLECIEKLGCVVPCFEVHVNQNEAKNECEMRINAI